MSEGVQTAYTWTAPDGSVHTYTPPPSTAPPDQPTPPIQPPATGFEPSVPADVLAQLKITPSLDETWATKPEWGKRWANNWFGGNNFNQQPLDSNNVGWTPGELSLGVSNNGRTGCMVVSNPSNPCNPGFTYTTGYAEADLESPGDPAWFAWWTNGQNWPDNGEHDVVEWLGANPHRATGNYHDAAGAHNSGTIAGNWSGRHRHGEFRTPGSATYYWDGKPVVTHKTTDREAPHYLLLSIGDRNGGGQGPVVCRRVTVWPLA